MKKRLLCGILLVMASAVSAQDFLAKNEYFFSLTNRMDLMVVQDPAEKAMSLGIVFQCGSLTERDAFHGLSYIYEKIVNKRLIEQLRKNIPEHEDSSAVSIFTETTYEYVSIRLIFPRSRLEKVLQIVHQTVSLPFSDSEIKEAADLSNSEYQYRLLDPSSGLAQKIGQALWENDYKKRTTITEWNDSTMALIPDKISNLRERYFCPGNCFMVIKGNIEQKSTYDLVDKTFQDWKRCTINPFTRFPAPNYRLILHSMQLIDENPGTQAPFFRIAYPGPNTYEDRRSNYCALVLSGIISSPASKIHRYLADSCGLASVSLHNDLAKYISQITFELTPEENDIASGYECFHAFLTGASDSIFGEDELNLGKESVIANYRARRSGQEHVSQIIKFWSSVTLNDYSTFEDSIRSVTTNDMMNLFNKYFYKRHYVAGLSIRQEARNSTGVDSVFTPTGGEISSYRINFLKNSAAFSGKSDDSTFNSLVQFLKINPELVIKVNGVCHKDELLKVSDKAMLEWVNALGGQFILNPPSLIKKKKFRLDVYRSMTLIKKLTEAGIDSRRLSGTGNLARAAGETEPFQYAHFSQVITNR